MRRFILFKPLAILLALLLTPSFAWFESTAGIKLGSNAQAFQASAQTPTGGCTPSPSNAIIQVLCPKGSASYLSDLVQFESDSVTAYLAYHNLPPADAALIYSLGREDLRDAIRAQMLAQLEAISAKPTAQRTTHEQNLYNWMQYLTQQNEIAYYQSAINEYQRWKTNPCEFTLDPNIAKQYGLYYNGAPFCYPTYSTLFGGPSVPAESYFLAYGLLHSYGSSALTNPGFGALVADTQVKVSEVVGIGTGAAAVIAGSIGAYIGVTTATYLGALAAWNGALAASGTVVTGTSAALTSSAAALLQSSAGAQFFGVAGSVAGPVSIILIGAAIGVAAALQVFSDEQTKNDLNNLNNTLTQVTLHPPDLNAFVNDPTGNGQIKLNQTLVAQTLPSHPSTAALPLHRAATDLNFSIAPSGGNLALTATLTYQDWNGLHWSAQTYDGWFVQTCNSGTSCAQADSIIASLDYVDWSGMKWTASRFGNKFVSTKGVRSATDVVCPADETTGVSPETNFSACSSYVSSSIPLKDANGNNITVSINVPPVAPSFNGPSTLNFTANQPSSITISASGSPAPAISLTSTLPAGFSFAQTTPGTGTLSYSGASGSAGAGTYSLTFVASSSAGTTQPITFTVNVTTALQITSSSTLSVTSGIPVNFLVTTTGYPRPSLSISQYLIPGLTFTDNGNGTGTISGIAQTPPNGLPLTTFCLILGNSCGITATNSLGSITQSFSLTINPPPSASLVSASANFTAGIPNSVRVSSTGAVTPVSYLFSGPSNISPGQKSFPAPSWLSFHDNGDGSGVLSGTPPAGTTGAFQFTLAPQTSGVFPSPVSANFTLNVTDQPFFTGSNVAAFVVGNAGSFEIDTNESPVSANGYTLPQGLTFQSGAPAYITGTPAPGTGGAYAVHLTATNSYGSVSQTVTVNIYEAPHIESADSAIFLVGKPSSFAVTTTGYPNLSTKPTTQNAAPPTDPSSGQGMHFIVTGLPPDLQFSNLNPQGLATGTLTIQGTPSAADAGLHKVQITAQNGVGAVAQQTLELNIVAITGPAPTSSRTCNGNYNGTFKGNLTVTAGQNCMFIGGGVTGSIQQFGGNLVLDNSTVAGYVDVMGPSTFSLLPGTVIGRDLTISKVASEATTSQICGAKLEGSLSIRGIATPFEIGSASPDSCPGNFIGGGMSINDSTAPAAVFNNNITQTLVCSQNTAITGAGNTATKKLGQCSAF